MQHASARRTRAMCEPKTVETGEGYNRRPPGGRLTNEATEATEARTGRLTIQLENLLEAPFIALQNRLPCFATVRAVKVGLHDDMLSCC